MTFLQIHAVWIPRCSQSIFLKFYSAFRLKTWVLGAKYFIFNFQHIQLYFRYFNNIFSKYFSNDYSKTLCHSPYFNIFSTAESILSVLPLVLAHPLKINHLLKTNSFVPCLGTIPSHLDKKDGKRVRWRILWDCEEYFKKSCILFEW